MLSGWRAPARRSWSGARQQADLAHLVALQEVEHRDPRDIIADIRALEGEITKGLDELEGML